MEAGSAGSLCGTATAGPRSRDAWAYPGRIGRVYTSEWAWRNVFVPVLGLAFLLVGFLWLWKGAY
jgi:hypothetical protein